MTTRFEYLRYSVEDGIAEIRLDRPPLNLIDLDLSHEYLAALDLANSDQAAKVIVLSGEGKGLSAGVDIKVLRDYDSAQMREFVELFYVEQVRRVRGVVQTDHGCGSGLCTRGCLHDGV